MSDGVELSVLENGQSRFISLVTSTLTSEGAPLDAFLRGNLVVTSFLREDPPLGPPVCHLAPTSNGADGEFSRFVAYLHSGVSGTSKPKCAKVECGYPGVSLFILAPSARISASLTVICAGDISKGGNICSAGVEKTGDVLATEEPFEDPTKGLRSETLLSLPLPFLDDTPLPQLKKEGTLLSSSGQAVIESLPSLPLLAQQPSLLPSSPPPPPPPPPTSMTRTPPIIPGVGVIYASQAEAQKCSSGHAFQSLLTSLVSRIVTGDIPFPLRRSFMDESAVEGAFRDLQAYTWLERVEVRPEGMSIPSYYPRGEEIKHWVDGPLSFSSGGRVVTSDVRELIMPTAYPPGTPLDISSKGDVYPLSPLMYFAGVAPLVLPWDGTPGVSDKFASLIDYFTEPARMAAVRKNEGSPPLTLWTRPHIAENVVRKALRKFKCVTTQSLRMGMYGNIAGCNLFKPHFAKSVYQALGSKRVLDMCAGWGCRLMGAMGTPGVTRYIGFDPNPSLVSGHTEMIQKFGGAGGGQYTVVPLPFEVGISVGLSEEDRVQGFDTAFTSPPYFDLEVYEDRRGENGGGQQQSITTHGAGGLQGWLQSWYFPMMDKAWSHLRPGGHLAVYINDHAGKGSSQFTALPSEGGVLGSGVGFMQALDTEFLGICHPMLEHAALLKDCRWVGILGLEGEGHRGAPGGIRPLWVWRKGEPVDPPPLPAPSAYPIYTLLLQKHLCALSGTTTFLPTAVQGAATTFNDGALSQLKYQPSEGRTGVSLGLVIPRKKRAREEGDGGILPYVPPPKEPSFSLLFDALLRKDTLQAVIGLLGGVPQPELPPLPWINDDSTTSSLGSSERGPAAGKQPITLLCLAAKLGRADILQLLCDTYKADPNAQAPRSGYTPLGLAVYEGHHSCIVALLERKADPSLRNKWGESALVCGEKKWGSSDPESVEGMLLQLLKKVGAVERSTGGEGGGDIKARVAQAKQTVRLALGAPSLLKTPSSLPFCVREFAPSDKQALHDLYAKCQEGHIKEDAPGMEVVHKAWCAKVLGGDFGNPGAHFGAEASPRSLLLVVTLSREAAGSLPLGSLPLCYKEEDGTVLVACGAIQPMGESGLPKNEAPSPQFKPLCEDARQGLVGEFLRLCVEPRARRSGVARALVQHLEACAGALGYKSLYLSTLRQFTPARRLYGSIGYSGYSPSSCGSSPGEGGVGGGDATPFAGTVIHLIHLAKYLPSRHCVSTSNNEGKVRTCFESAGWLPSSSPLSLSSVVDSDTLLLTGAWDVAWRTSTSLKFLGAGETLFSLIPSLPPRLRVLNRVPNPKPLASKTGLLSTLLTAPALSYFLPTTLIVPSQQPQRGAAIERLRVLHNTLLSHQDLSSCASACLPPLEPTSSSSGTHHMPPSQCKSGLWIVKPDYMYSGKGIALVDSPERAEAHISGGGGEGIGGAWVVQKYIEAPLLYRGGRKFDLRLHVAFLDSQAVYLFKEGFARCTSSPYSLGGGKNAAVGGSGAASSAPLVLDAHITNNSYQKDVEGFGATEPGNMISFHQLQLWLDECTPRLSINDDLFPQWRVLIAGIFDKGAPALLQGWDERSAMATKCFELFGVDVILDECGRTWLLEVNTNSGLYDFDNPWAKSMFDGMLRDLKALAIDPVFGQEGGVIESVPPVPRCGGWDLIASTQNPPPPVSLPQTFSLTPIVLGGRGAQHTLSDDAL